MDLDAHTVVCSSVEQRRQLSLAADRQHLLDLEPVNRHGLGGQTESFATGSQRDLGESRGRHDRLAKHFVIL